MVNLHKGLQDSDQYAQINDFKTTWLKPKNQKKKKRKLTTSFDPID